MQQFPQELVDQIIDDVAATANTSSLGTCGGVCRRWLPRSRKHLFSHVALSNTDPAAILSFVDIVEASSMPILSFVRSLGLCLFHRQPEVSDGNMVRQLQKWPALAELFTHTAKVIAQAEEALHTYIPRLGASLTRLELVLAGDLPLRVIAELMSALPFLTHLRICGDDSYGIVHSAPTPPAATCLPHLHTMGISLRRGTDAVFEWLLSQPEPPVITSLALGGFANREPVTSIDAYIQRFGPKIVSLSLEYWLNGRVATEALKLAHLDQPPSLCISHSPGSTRKSFPAPSHYCPRSRDTGPNWPQIDAILGTPRFGALRRLAFTRQGTKKSVITAEVKKLMPQATARSILANEVVIEYTTPSTGI
ncbi:hypothetical protein C8R44DRAFT_984619 [Mycena epipterygia]|nr:hypothetical protein C8R44DRAFT_984619 [Mycena epipterygia]